MSAELVHLSCWTLLAAMVVFLVIGGIRTFHEFKHVLRERRARRNQFGRKALARRAPLAFRIA
jgi:hypothetical protein